MTETHKQARIALNAGRWYRPGKSPWHEAVRGALEKKTGACASRNNLPITWESWIGRAPHGTSNTGR